MSSYRQSSFDPMARQRPATRLEKAIAALAILAGLLMLVGAFSHGKGAPAWLHALDWGIAPLGLVEFGMASNYMQRARANRPEENYSPRALRFTALAFALLGVLLVAVGVQGHFARAAA